MTGTPGYRRRFGQHFLIDQQVIEQMIAAIAPSPNDRLVEIGPGLGALTRALIARVRSLEVIELDRDLAAQLPGRLDNPAGLQVHSGDVLKVDFSQLAEGRGPLRVVGNLPYNISSPLLFHLIAHRQVVQDMHFMLQSEVVDRLVAGPGSRIYGRLSVMVQLVCQADKLFSVSPPSFSPPPKVTSAVVRLIPRPQLPVALQDPVCFQEIVRLAFSQRRKILRNSLGSVLSEDQIRAAGVDPNARPETLDLVAFAALSNQLAS